MTDKKRIERDSMGEVAVPNSALYGAQTQRAVDNFPPSGMHMPARFIHALGMIKAAAARTNASLGLLDAVIARLASRTCGSPVHPNDHVNMGQSSNDVVPTAIHVSACIAIQEQLRPGLHRLRASLSQRADELADIVKTGRTHLMDAMPLRFDQELGAWGSQVDDAIARIDDSQARLQRLAIGGTAVGTGINAHPEFGNRVAALLAAQTHLPLVSSNDHFRDLSSQDSAVEMSGQLNTLAVALMKFANDLRRMNSGPLAGLGEIRLPVWQPGSSIMPGKVNIETV